ISTSVDIIYVDFKNVFKFLAAGTHLGGTSLDLQMQQHVYSKKSSGIYNRNLKILLVACAIVAIENPAAVSVASSRDTGQRAELKFAAATAATPIAELFTSRTFPSSAQAWLSYVNLPTPALCVTASPLCYVDIAIPCNKGARSVGLMWWVLAQKVLCVCDTISHEHPWEVMPDLCFYWDPEEIEKEEQATAEKVVTHKEFWGEWTAPAPELTAAQPGITGHSEGMQCP
uniref:Small ribosomal subunit protein uS2 C-terminal domain-containing protein n=1 Tax=Myotis lucifugus TaxID=59463 RepID=G1Q675_MYOLU